MRITAILTLAALGVGATVSGCAVVPEPQEVEIEEVVIAPPVPVCYEVAELQKVEVPAETKTVYGVSVIENPPYQPITQRTEQKIIVKQAEVFYVTVDPETGDQTEVTNFCDSNIKTGRVGPGEGELAGPAVPVE